MDGWRTRRHETEVRSAAAGTEVGIALVRSSPWISLTGSLLSTCICCPVCPCLGPDMSAFPTAGHLLSWAGVVPRLDESAGKRRSTRVRHGAPWLKPVLVQCAWGAARAKGTYLQAQFFRLKARRGPKKAAIAVAASILTAVYHMLKDGTFYQDLGADYLVKRDPARTVAKLARRIKDLGFDVQYRATA